MRKKRIIITLGILLPIVVIVALLTSIIIVRKAIGIPPKFEKIEQQFTENYDEIQQAADFLIDSGYKSIHINSDLSVCYVSDGQVYFEEMHNMTTDTDKLSAAEKLFRDMDILELSKNNNVIEICVWKRFDVYCGICYSMDQNGVPDVQFLTESKPLNKTGWYYYVADYDKWRIENT